MDIRTDAILFLDSQVTRADKLAAICKRIRPAAVIARLLPGKYMLEVMGNGLQEERPIPIAVRAILIHYRDDVEAEKLPTSSVNVWFGGMGAELEPNKPWAIHRRLPSSHSVVEQLKEEEVREFLDWVWAPERETLRVPALLQPPKRLEHIASLAILCQGYLLSYLAFSAESTESEPQVLDLVGKLLFKHERSHVVDLNLQAANLKWRYGDVQRSSWWLAPFAGEDLKESLPKVADRLSSSLEDEWGSRPPVALRNCMKLLQGEKKISDPEFVATIYRNLVDRLTR